MPASKIQTDDLFLVERNGKAYKATGQELRDFSNPFTKQTDTVISGKAQDTLTLTATPGTVTGGIAPYTYSTKWQVSDDGTSNWSDIAGASGLTYKIQPSDIDKYLRAVTTASDSTTPVAQTIALPSIASAKVIDIFSSFTWNANTDEYTRTSSEARLIDTQVKMRRCVLNASGDVAYYLDADNSTKKAGDWLRLCETTELDTPYTGTHGSEIANTKLRGSAPIWSAGTYSKGQLVQRNGSVWECLAGSTTAEPKAGTIVANLTGADGQVMVEIPKFSVWHETAPDGSYLQHTFHLKLGEKTDGAWQVHPAFVKPDGSTRSHFYIGAYQGTGTNGNGSVSGVNNATNFTRAQCRSACASRGAGWHQLSYWEYNAIQWLLYTEYEDMNSQKVLGNGAMEGRVYVVGTGLSNIRGNRSENKYTNGGRSVDYVSYRGVENLYGRAWQWADGFNINNYNVYLSNNPAVWADDTQANYIATGTVPSGSNYIRDLLAQAAFLPGSLNGASATTFVGDYLYTNSGWRVALVGGSAYVGAPDGALCLGLYGASSYANPSVGGRAAYAV